MEIADTILAAHRVTNSLQANFFIISTPTSRSIRTTAIAESMPSTESVTSINQFMQNSTGDKELLLSLRPISLSQFRGINIIPIEPFDTSEGLTNPLEAKSTHGIFHSLHVPGWDHPDTSVVAALGNTSPFADTRAVPFVATIPDFVTRSHHDITIRHPASYQTFNDAVYDENRATAEMNELIPVNHPLLPQYPKIRIRFRQILAHLYPSALANQFSGFYAVNTHFKMFYHTLEPFKPTDGQTAAAKALAPGVINIAAGGGANQFDTLCAAENATDDAADAKNPYFTRLTSVEQFRQRYHARATVTENAGGVAAVADADATAYNFAGANLGAISVQASADIFGNNAHRMFQFLLDVLYVGHSAQHRTEIFMPSVNVKLGGIDLRVPAWPDYSRLVVVRPKINLITETLLYGIGGRETGVTAIGQELYEEYDLPHQQRKEFRVKMRLGIVLAHEEHIIRMPEAKYRRYVSGAGIKVCNSRHHKDEKCVTAFTSAVNRRIKKDVIPDTTIIVATPRFKIEADATRMGGAPRAEDRNEVHPYGWHFDGVDTVLTEKNCCAPYFRVFRPRAAFADNNDTGLEAHILFGNCIRRITTSNTPQANPKMVPVAGGGAVACNAQVPAGDTVFQMAPAPLRKPSTGVYCWQTNYQKHAFVGSAVDTNINAHYKTTDMTTARGPFRYLESHSAMDTWNGRAFQSYKKPVQT